MIKLEEGKYYKTRDGQKRGPMKFGTKNWWMTDGLGGTADFYYTHHNPTYAAFAGKSSAMNKNEPMPDDLIEEWKEEKMSKFKVGDVVNAIVDEPWARHWQNVSISRITADGCWAFDKDNCEGLLYEHQIELAKPKSPVIEKTVKSIVPGVYGAFVVGAVDSMKRVHVIQGNSEMFTASELEAAAQTFMELAKFLREGE